MSQIAGIQDMSLGNGKTLAVCEDCGSPVPEPYPFQHVDNKIYTKLACAGCGRVFAIRGPFPTFEAAGVKRFK